MKKTLKIPSVLYRTGTSVVGKDGEMTLSISSNVPYKRYDWYADEEYWEVLDHSPSSVDTSRLIEGTALLFNHKSDIQLGTIRAPEFRDGKCYVQAKLSAADDTKSYRTRIEEGILKDASVGYRITDDGVCIGAKEELPIYKFKWAPHEASMVTIPADITVGVGRSREDEAKSEMREISVEVEDSLDKSFKKKQTPLATPMKISALAKRHFSAKEGGEGGGGETPEKDAVDVKAERIAAVKAFQANCKKIDDYCASIGNPEWRKAAEVIATKHKLGDASFEDFRAEACIAMSNATEKQSLEIIGERQQDPSKRLSIGHQFVNSKGYRDAIAERAQGKRVASLEVDYPCLGIRGKVAMAQRAGFTSSDLSAVNVMIQQGVVTLGVQRLTILDLIAPGTTSAAAIIYPRENSFGTIDGVAVVTTNGAMPMAGTVAERGLKPLWEPDLTTETANVKKVAITTKVPDEFLSDFPASQSYIDERLPYMVDTRTEQQILYGDGLGNNIKGITTMAGIQTRAVVTTSDATVASSLKQGLTDISVNAQFEPDGYAFHPYDWETASLLKDLNGQFLAGGPFFIPYGGGVFMQMYTFWGKPCVVSTAVTYGRPLAGAWKLGAQYFLREGMRIEMTNANEDDFRRNLVALRAEHRLALAVYRPVAFLEFTGFPARA